MTLALYQSKMEVLRAIGLRVPGQVFCLGHPCAKPYKAAMMTALVVGFIEQWGLKVFRAARPCQVLGASNQPPRVVLVRTFFGKEALDYCKVLKHLPYGLLPVLGNATVDVARKSI